MSDTNQEQGATGSSGRPAAGDSRAAGDPLSGLLGALLGGGTGQESETQAAAQSGDDVLGGLLGSLLGGQQAAAPAGGDALGGLLGALLGGSGQQAAASGGGLEGLLGAFLGGGGGSTGGAAGLSPMVDGLADKLHISPAIAATIVTFVLSKLQSGMSGGVTRASGIQSGAQAPDLGELLQQMGGDRQMAAELAQQTGLDSRAAMQGLQEVLAMFGGSAAR